MCGIRLLVLERTISHDETCTALGDHHKAPLTLQRRGPDGCGEQQLNYNNRQIIFQASVLQMRDEFTQQPVLMKAASVAWNGELYQQLHHTSDDDTIQDVWKDHVSDTTIFAHAVQSILEKEKENNYSPIMERLAHLCSTLINAEYAFCILTETAIYYGRDPLGRRSLLVYQQPSSVSSEDNAMVNFELASVATSITLKGWNEVPPGHVFGYAWREARTLKPQSFSHIPQQTLSLCQNFITTPEQASMHLMQLLKVAVKRRVSLHSGSVAVLFSGGLDSVVLAALTLKLVPPSFSVWLVNVSFVENHSHEKTEQQSSKAADTQAAWASYQELKQLFPSHTHVRFISHQVDWNEIQKVESHIRALMYPKDGTMDLNISTALWFAAQAGAPGRVLLSGLGADEQMGGYGRHRKAWEHGHIDALRKELDLDLDRLWERNLGRDDRVLSDHGTEARYPFLDTNVMDYLASLPLHLVCDFSLPPGQGDKRILRLVAEALGVQTASSMVKRAIQFGSRISHVCDRKRFGSRRKATVGASKGSQQQEEKQKSGNE